LLSNHVILILKTHRCTISGNCWLVNDFKLKPIYHSGEAMRVFLSLCLLFLTSAFLPSTAAQGGVCGDIAPEFPDGQFSDGEHYRLGDFRSKFLVVLFFYEQECPTCRATIPHRNMIVKQYENEPVKFIGVGAGDSLEDVKSYVRETHLAMPVFADSHGLMQKSYGFKISLHNIYQIRLISPLGVVIGYDMEPASIDRALRILSSGKDNYLGSPVENKGSQLARLNNQAVAAIESGDSAGAIEKLKALLKEKPDYRIAKENLRAACASYAYDLEDQGKPAEAEKMMKQALDLARELYGPQDKEYKEAVTEYAGVLSRLGMYAEARMLVEKLNFQE
jgi:peroxiredoxin